ncbi:MAG: family 78 glycoside hydrolase catalytic domain [Bacteroidales bacterium]|nr:family 78 glycoside hydrolase catalytic domain [Bacteroidales bacterium]
MSYSASAKHYSRIIRRVVFTVPILICIACTGTRTSLETLTVEYSVKPLGMDVEQPRFGWQMMAPDNTRGVYQTAYRIIVKDPAGEIVWDSEKVDEGSSVAIRYQGRPLQSSTRYSWKVTVWDQDQEDWSDASWFETGLMNPDPDLSAWEGAQWIGGGDKDLVFYSHYQLIFKLKYALSIAEGSTRAGVVYGANDIRLMDKYKNIFQAENGEDESYIKLELDISGLEGSSGVPARLNVYRVGYTREDRADEPIKYFDIKPSVIHPGNKNDRHDFEISSAFGRLSIVLDGESEFFIREKTEEPAGFEARFGRGGGGASVNLNPVGSGGNYIPFGMVCDIGFSIGAGQQATCTDLEILNDRLPNNTLFKEDLSGDYEGIFAGRISVAGGSYLLNGGQTGALVLANPSRNSTPMLRTGFEAPKRVAAARLYVTARGIYEIFLNGEKVGQDFYNPGLTQYNKTHMYQTYDVTEMIRVGSNSMGAMMAEGWWSGLLSFGSIWNHFGDRQSLLAKLVLTYKDGSREVITSNDANWKYYNNGPVVYSSLDLGEVYDANREVLTQGWTESDFDDSGWKSASMVPLEGTSFAGSEREFDGSLTEFNFGEMQLLGQIGNSAGVFETLTAQSMKEVREGVYVYDMGQNFVGVPRITIQNGSAGDTMVLRYAEMLYPDLEESGKNVGMIMTENYRAALCQDLYIMKDGDQVFQPKFTSRGYQYIEITGIHEPLPPGAVEGIAISSVLDLTADYHTSNEKVNQLWSNLVWSNVDNFLSIPTDCPQRNERMGWSGDISVFSRTATYVSNADQFLRRHMLAMRDVQKSNGKFTDVAPVGGGFGGVLWGSAGITVAWEVYQQYKDISLLEEHYDAMVAYADYLQSTINEETGITSDGQLGDWLGPQNNMLGTPFLTSAYHVYDLWVMKNVAEILGKQEDADRFEEWYRQRKEFFNHTFINEEGRTMGLVGGGRGFDGRVAPPAEWKLADTQTSYAVGLALGTFRDDLVSQMGRNLAETVRRRNADDSGEIRPEYSLMTGFIGTAWINNALSDQGYSEHAYRLLQNNQYPSWLYAIDQGATSIWERLNGYTVENGFGGNNSMNSFNHYSFGAVGQWMMAYSLGIQRDDPGFKKFILQPEPDPTGEMTWAEGYYDSVYGRISSSWKIRDGRLVYETVVPANTEATLYLPAISVGSVLENGREANSSEGVSFLKFEKGRAVYQLKSGSYSFESSLD